MKKITRYIAPVTLCFVLLLNSCTKDYLDVNTDPNNPAEVTPELLLPPVIAHTAFIMGGQYQIIGGFWSQYWTQGSTGNQYNAYDQYQVPNTTFDRQWTELYSDVLTDCRILSIKGEETGKPNYSAIGYFMEAYVFHVLTDLHGDIPYSEALQGVDNISPHFDSQSKIYDELITLIDIGISKIDRSDLAIYPDADDFIFHGDMDLWEKFANTLKLRIYMRQSEVRPSVASAGIQQMLTNGATFLEEGEDAVMTFVNSAGYQHPLFTEIENLGNQNLIASNTSINYLLANNDPRVDVFYAPASTGTNAGSQAGIDQGDGKTPTFPASAKPDDFSQPGAAIAGPDAPATFISAAEAYFLLSEAAARGWISDDAQALYEAGITASFTRWGLTDVDASDYYSQISVAFPSGGSLADKLKAIITEKWVSMNSNESVEAWCEWRRTNYPDFFVHSATSLIGTGEFPQRLPYPNSEIQTNPNTPVQPLLTAKVWWDVN